MNAKPQPKSIHVFGKSWQTHSRGDAAKALRRFRSDRSVARLGRGSYRLVGCFEWVHLMTR